ncbi:MAG: hypothetical protein ACYCPS_06265 [Candidatus Saccharimonadales bacterium]
MSMSYGWSISSLFCLSGARAASAAEASLQVTMSAATLGARVGAVQKRAVSVESAAARIDEKIKELGDWRRNASAPEGVSELAVSPRLKSGVYAKQSISFSRTKVRDLRKTINLVLPD